MTALPDSSPEEAILEYLKTMNTDYKIALPNIPFSPVIGTPYFRTFIIPAPTERLGFGNADRHSGLLQVDAVAPAKKGMPLAVNMARLVENHFDRKTITTEAGLQIKIIDAPYSGGHRQDPDWYSIPVSVVYTILN